MLQPFNDFEQIDLPRRNPPPSEPFMPINLDCMPPPFLFMQGLIQTLILQPY